MTPCRAGHAVVAARTATRRLPRASHSEALNSQGGGLFLQYRARFTAVELFAGANSGSNSSFWYSWNRGLVHWVAFTSETWTMSAAQISAQTAWLTADLAAVNRTATPWVLAYSHKK